MLPKSCSGFLLLTIILIGSEVYAGYPGVVDDHIWHRVLKVLSKGYGGSKIILDHPRPAYLVDSYTKVYSHAPSYHHYEPYHHGHAHHGLHGGHHGGVSHHGGHHGGHHVSHHGGHHVSHHGEYGVPVSSYGAPSHYHSNHYGHY